MAREAKVGGATGSGGLREYTSSTVSGRISRCHREGPGSIPGRCSIFSFQTNTLVTLYIILLLKKKSAGAVPLLEVLLCCVLSRL